MILLIQHGSGHCPGWWHSIDADGELRPNLRCPNAHVRPLTARILEDGSSVDPVVCPFPDCNFAAPIVLAGWSQP